MNGGAGLCEARALKSPRTMNGLPVPPLLMPLRKAERWEEGGRKGGWSHSTGFIFLSEKLWVTSLPVLVLRDRALLAVKVYHKLYCVKKTSNIPSSHT